MDANAAATWAGVVITLVIAIVGWSRSNASARRAQEQADKAGARAERAEQRADRAIELAESAEARAARLERQANERRDISWERRWIADACTLSLRNVGTDAAHDVELHIDPAGEQHFTRQSVRMASIEPTDAIGVNLTVIVREARQAGWFSTVIDETRPVRVHARLTWRSAAGVHGSREWLDLQL